MPQVPRGMLHQRCPHAAPLSVHGCMARTPHAAPGRHVQRRVCHHLLGTSLGARSCHARRSRGLPAPRPANTDPCCLTARGQRACCQHRAVLHQHSCCQQPCCPISRHEAVEPYGAATMRTCTGRGLARLHGGPSPGPGLDRCVEHQRASLCQGRIMLCGGRRQPIARGWGNRPGRRRHRCRPAGRRCAYCLAAPACTPSLKKSGLTP